MDKSRLSSSLLYPLALVLLFVTPAIILACSFGFFYVTEVSDLNRYTPAIAEKQLWQGQVSILQPAWGLRYLYPAYRGLVGKPLSSEEQEALKTYFGTHAQDPYSELALEVAAKQAYVAWVEKRDETFPGGFATREFTLKDADYAYYVNCLPDAYHTALAALEARKQIYGRDDLAWWVRNQNNVFDACFPNDPGGLNEPRRPHTELSFFQRILSWFGIHPASDDQRQDDYAYQYASFSFYTDDYDSAASQFNNILKSKTSPWKYQAGYGYVRSLIRKANAEYSIYNRNDKEIPDEYATAIKKLDEMRKDPLWENDEGIQRLIDLAAVRADPVRRMLDAEDELASKDPDIFAGALDDIDTTVYWNKLSPEQVDTLLDRANDGTHDAILWMTAYRYESKKAFEIASQYYQKDKSPRWLLIMARQALTDPKGKNVPQIVQQLGTVSLKDPGYLTAQSYRGEFYLANNQTTEALKLATTVLAQKNLLITNDALNTFNDIAMRSRSDLKDILSFAARFAVYEVYDGGEQSIGGQDLDIAKPVLTQLNFNTPVDQWLPAIKSSSLPGSLKKYLYQTLLFRSFLMSRNDVMRATAGELNLSGVVSATDDDKARFETVRNLFSRDDSLGPDAVGILDTSINESWCFSDEKVSDTTSERSSLTRALPINALAGELIAYTNAHPEDPNIPQVLSAYVARSRYENCKDDNMGKNSKAIFDLLHEKYPNSSWAVKTKYWYN